MYPNIDYGLVLSPNQNSRIRNKEIDVRVITNSKGLHDVEHSYEKPPGTYRILLLGDSFIEATQVKIADTFAKQLERKLNAADSDVKFEVINGGAHGMGQVAELLFFRSQGFRYQPDLVLMGLFPATDLVDNNYNLIRQLYNVPQLNNRPTALIEDGQIQIVHHHKKWEKIESTSDWWIGTKQFLTKNSRVYVLLRNLIKERMPAVDSLLRRLKILAEISSPASENQGYISVLVHEVEYTEDYLEAWEITKSITLSIRDEVTKKGAQFAVFVIPRSSQIYQDWWLEMVGRHPELEGRSLDRDKPDFFVEHFLSVNNIPHLTLLRQFRDYAQENNEPLYYHKDEHFNFKGHELTTELLFQWIIESDLVPHGLRD